MHKTMVFGAGRIGILVSALLADSGDYQVFLADIAPPDSLPTLDKNQKNLEVVEVDVNDTETVKKLIDTHHIDTLISCLPFHCNEAIAKIAVEKDANYFDLTEDVGTTKSVANLSKSAKGTFMPQCGLAPGFISIVTNNIIQRFDSVDSVTMRVGALPTNVSNPLHYALTWSTEGLINEYVKPCRALREGEIRWCNPLEDLEEIKINGLTYEAFNTSGGVGSLIETYQGKINTMNYKTIRYPGHCEKMRFLLDGLKLKRQQSLLSQILENAIPQMQQDVVLIYVSVQGFAHGTLQEMNFAEKFYPETHFGSTWSAIQMTTASSICGVVDLIVHDNKFSGRLVHQEEVDFHAFEDNRFGQYFRSGKGV